MLNQETHFAAARQIETSTSSGASGIVSGDASVGTDTFSGVGSASGSSFADTITGSNNPNNTAEEFSGRAGNDFIDGKGGFDRAYYNSDSLVASGIHVDLASQMIRELLAEESELDSRELDAMFRITLGALS